MLANQVAKQLVQGHLALLGSSNRDFPIPMGYWILCRKLFGLLTTEPDPLFPTFQSLQSRGDSLEIPQLKKILAGELLGAWALDAQTIKLLWELLWRDTPQLILEFGSGGSTLLFAAYASLLSQRTGLACRVISLEADGEHKAAVERRLKENNLGEASTILQLGRDDRGVYDIAMLPDVLAGAAIDYVLVDGPSGPPGCRRDTLPAVLPFCKSGCRWLLDDAFRDGELEFLRSWRRFPKIKIEGIFPVGKGLAAGQVS